MTARIYHLDDHRPLPITITPDRRNWTILSLGDLRCAFPPKWLRDLAEACNDIVWLRHAPHEDDDEIPVGGWSLKPTRNGVEIRAWGRVIELTDLQFVALRNRLAARVAEVESKEGMRK